MYTFEAIDEKEYKLIDEYGDKWFKYERRNLKNSNERNNGNVFIFKSNSFDENIFFGEVVGSRIVEKTIGNSCTAKLAKRYKGCGNFYQNGVISFYYYSEQDEMFSSKRIMQEYLLKEKISKDDNLRFFPTIDVVIKALSYYILHVLKRTYQEFDAVKQQYIDMIIFDCRFGNYDRSLENWQLFRDKNAKIVSLYPLFDNEAVLGFDEDIEKSPKKILEYCRNQKMKYYTPQSSKEERGANMKEILTYLMEKFPKETKIALNKVREFSLNDLSMILDEFPDMLEERKEYAKKMCFVREFLINKYIKEIEQNKEERLT